MIGKLLHPVYNKDRRVLYIAVMVVIFSHYYKCFFLWLYDGLASSVLVSLLVLPRLSVAVVPSVRVVVRERNWYVVFFAFRCIYYHRDII